MRKTPHSGAIGRPDHWLYTPLRNDQGPHAQSRGESDSLAGNHPGTRSGPPHPSRLAQINHHWRITRTSERALDRHVLIGAGDFRTSDDFVSRPFDGYQNAVAQTGGANGFYWCEDVLVLTPAEIEREFTGFVEETEPRLLRALVSAFGSEVGREATRDALAYAWENWGRVSEMENPVGYLFRVGQSRSRSYRRERVWFPEVPQHELPDVDPRLPSALGRLSRMQRAAVVLVFVEEMPEREAAEALGVSRASVRKHADRGLAKLRRSLRVSNAD